MKLTFAEYAKILHRPEVYIFGRRFTIRRLIELTMEERGMLTVIAKRVRSPETLRDYLAMVLFEPAPVGLWWQFWVPRAWTDEQVQVAYRLVSRLTLADKGAAKPVSRKKSEEQDLGDWLLELGQKLGGPPQGWLHTPYYLVNGLVDAANRRLEARDGPPLEEPELVDTPEKWYAAWGQPMPEHLRLPKKEQS